MTPEDTTRLRALAEAVRNAGAVMRAAREHSDHALTAASADEYRKAAEAFRAAQKALYRDAPPDGIILALLDEMERLRGIVGRVGTILSDEGCDCYCDCDSHHLPECELCLGCRIGNEVDGTSWSQCGTSGGEA